jgi:hypothetical protein
MSKKTKQNNRFTGWRGRIKIAVILVAGMIIGSLMTGEARAFVFGGGKQISQWMQGGASLIQLRNETNSVRFGS